MSGPGKVLTAPEVPISGLTREAGSLTGDGAEAADALSRDCSGRAARLSSAPPPAVGRRAAPPCRERPLGRGWSGRRKGIIETASAIRAHGCPGRTDGVL